MKESDLIKQIVKSFKRSPDQCNEPFECDAEIVMVGDQMWGMSMDEFSPDEDLFTSEDPVRLGANLATATLSDLFAAGVEPRFFMQSVSLPRTEDKHFIDGLMEGVRTTLEKTNCVLCGGDVGSGETWRYCGVAMGPVSTDRPLTHRLPEVEQTLWVTGTLGDANLAALHDTATPQFELRLTEAELVRKYATACIDTSGGLLDAVWLLHDQSPGVRLSIDMQKIPFAEKIIKTAGHIDFPPEAALLGGAGEYELLFAAPKNTAIAEFSNIATAIGTISPDEFSGVDLICRSGNIKPMEQAPPCPRDVADTEEHIQSVMQMALALFNE